jgi:hypothetical protein
MTDPPTGRWSAERIGQHRSSMIDERLARRPSPAAFAL